MRMFLEDITGEFAWSRWQAETFLPVTLPTEAEEKPEEIFTALPVPQHHCGWLWSPGWLSVKSMAFCTAAVRGPQEAFLAVTAPCSNNRGLFSLCAKASPLVPSPGCGGEASGSTLGQADPQQPVQRGALGSPPARPGAAHAVQAWQSQPQNPTEQLLFASSHSLTESNYVVSLPLCCQNFLILWSNLAKLLCRCVSFEMWIVPMRGLLFLTSLRLPRR